METAVEMFKNHGGIPSMERAVQSMGKWTFSSEYADVKGGR